MAKLIFGNNKSKENENSNGKENTSLKEKTKGFKFKLPDTKREVSTSSNDTPIGNSESDAVKSNANDIRAKETNSVLKMSDDKYEVVADSVAEFSEESGNKFQQQLGILQQAIDGTGDLRDGMQNILLFLDDNPQYKNNISPKDVSIFVAACRKVAGITVTEKKTRVTKKKASSAMEQDILSDLADLDLDLGI